MKNLSIVDMLCMGFEEYEDMLRSKIESNKKYREAQEVFNKHLEALRKESSFAHMDEIDDCEIALETIARDTAFDMGFKMGLRFMASMPKAEVSGNE